MSDIILDTMPIYRHCANINRFFTFVYTHTSFSIYIYNNISICVPITHIHVYSIKSHSVRDSLLLASNGRRLCDSLPTALRHTPARLAFTVRRWVFAFFSTWHCTSKSAVAAQAARVYIYIKCGTERSDKSKIDASQTRMTKIVKTLYGK